MEQPKTNYKIQNYNNCWVVGWPLPHKKTPTYRKKVAKAQKKIINKRKKQKCFWGHINVTDQL